MSQSGYFAMLMYDRALPMYVVATYISLATVRTVASSLLHSLLVGLIPVTPRGNMPQHLDLVHTQLVDHSVYDISVKFTESAMV